MQRNRNTKKIFYIYLSLAIFVFAVAIIYSLFVTNVAGTKLLISRVQNTIVEKEALMLTKLDSYVSKTAEGSTTFISDESILESEENGVDFFVIKDDFIVAWSDNIGYPPTKVLFNNLQLVISPTSVYLYYAKNKNGYAFISTYNIYSKYSLQNNYLKNAFNKDFTLNTNTKISFDKTENAIVSSDGKYLFSINFLKGKEISKAQSVLLLGLFAFAFLLLMAAIYLFLKIKVQKQWMIFLIFTFIILLLRSLVQIFEIPSALYLSQLFHPHSFAMAVVFPSLGDVFLSSLAFLLVIYVLLKEVDFQKLLYETRTEKTKSVINIAIVTLLFIVSNLLFVFCKSLVENSTVSFNLSDASGIDSLSVIGFFSLAFCTFSFLLIATKLLFLLFRNSENKFVFWFTIFAAIVINTALTYIINAQFVLFNSFFVVFIPAVIFSQNRKKGNVYIGYILYILIVSFSFNFVFRHFSQIKELNKNKAIIREISRDQDPRTEHLFHEIEQKIYSDNNIKSYFSSAEVSYDTILNYINNTFFASDNHWKKYDLRLTMCDQYQTLTVEAENYTISCDSFFLLSLIDQARLTKCKNLYYLDYGTGQINYLGVIRFKINNDIVYTVYIEIDSKIRRDGYSQLLGETGIDPFEKIRDMSLARYVADTLVESYGNYNYKTKIKHLDKDNYSILSENSFKHLHFSSKENQVFVLSKKEIGKLDVIAPFSYLFMFFIVLTALISLVLNSAFDISSFNLGFATRLQFVIVGIIITSFTLITIISVVFIEDINEEKNVKTINDLAKSLQTEFEHKVRNLDEFGEATKDYLTELSVKFSKVFNTDINLYSLDGSLLASTQPQIFSKSLISDRINPTAFLKLSKDAETFFVHKEKIGLLKFSSAYMPFHNDDGNTVAYLNMPYFARHNEIRQEITGFLLALTNIYALFIVFSILVSLVISNYITRPLMLIGNKMKAVELGKINKPIVWKQNDEIGKLVKEYNKMIIELTHSADLLAESERASAWREMAQQVAHEIKNPLTPMRLSAQYLQKVLSEDMEDKVERTKKLTNTLIQQIDTLSQIATAFSDFAKMPKTFQEEVDLKLVINNTVELFNNFENIKIDVSIEDDKSDLLVYGDNKQLIRVFNNIINNSVQALDGVKDSKISIFLSKKANNYQIIVVDNGCGIAESEYDKIFVPNFTTKSSGTGLGLAIVKNIVSSMGGDISFKSEVGVGTEFCIELPVYVK
jgi:signal transduction histidine kinase